MRAVMQSMVLKVQPIGPQGRVHATAPAQAQMQAYGAAQRLPMGPAIGIGSTLFVPGSQKWAIICAT
jgi:hypothetical protein